MFRVMHRISLPKNLLDSLIISSLLLIKVVDSQWYGSMPKGGRYKEHYQTYTQYISFSIYYLVTYNGSLFSREPLVND